MNELIIKEGVVEINTDIIYRVVEMNYSGQIFIENLLPLNYLVKKSYNKVLIVRFGDDDTIPTKLFNYSGNVRFTYCGIVDENFNKIDTAIINPNFITWSNMGVIKNRDSLNNSIINNLEFQIKDYENLNNTNLLLVEDYKKQIEIKEDMIKVVKPKWYHNRYLWFFGGVFFTSGTVYLAGQLDG